MYRAADSESTNQSLPHAASVRLLRARWVLSGLALFCLAWTAYLHSFAPAAPVDNIEQLTWVRSLEWGYHKHPPLPTWLIWPAVQGLGLHAGTSYLMGALTKGLALAGFWWLMLRLRGPQYAAIALTAACCIVYYSRQLHLYNHNVVMLLTVVVAADCAWQAWRRRSLAWWGLLGVALGLGFLTKYQAVVTLCCVAVFVTLAGGWRDPLHRKGAALAVLVAAVIAAPHLWWLQAHPVNPLTYAMSSSLGAGVDWPTRASTVLAWVINHLFNRGLGALVLLLALAWWHRRPPPGSQPDESGGQPADAARLLIFAFACVPVAFIVLTVMLLGAEARKHWGTPYLIWMVPAIMEEVGSVRWQRVPMRHVLGLFLLIQMAMVTSHKMFTVTRELDTARSGPGQPMAMNWAADLARQARRELGGPILLVSGPESMASALSLELAERPLVLLNGDLAISPWVPAGAPGSCGGIEIGWGPAPPQGHVLKNGPPGAYWLALVPAGNWPCPLEPLARPPLTDIGGAPGNAAPADAPAPPVLERASQATDRPD